MIQPRYYQDDADRSIFEYFCSGNTGNPVVAMPTASGKSIVIAQFCAKVLRQWPRQRIVVCTHVKELIAQNYNKMLEAWPEAPAGVCSAGLNRRESMFPIIFGGIQSMVKTPALFGHRDLVLVDEAHLISGKDSSNYGKFIDSLRTVNPALKVVGFSATPWRLGAGHIKDGPIFTDVCYDLTSYESFNRLIAEGYLCNLIPKRTNLQLEVGDVAIRQGDYVQADLQKAVDKDSVTYAACKEILEQGYDRQSWLVFCSGIEHSEHVAATLQSFGIDCRAVHSKMPAEERDKIIADFRSGKLRAVSNNNVLTTGFDHPGLDMIAMLRPTTSTVLWVQMLGRGMRPCEGKVNCLVLDFAGNTKRLGPINDPVIPKKKGTGKDGVAPVRICDNCGVYNHARAAKCIGCGQVFEHDPKITSHAETAPLLKFDEPPKIESFAITSVIYNKHQKSGSIPIMKVTYFANNGLKKFDEYVAIESSGYAGRKAREWWHARMGTPIPPPSVDEALKYVSYLKVPRGINVWINKKYPEIMSCVW
jgi:DNA repair protein RadD